MVIVFSTLLQNRKIKQQLRFFKRNQKFLEFSLKLMLCENLVSNFRAFSSVGHFIKDLDKVLFPLPALGNFVVAQGIF